MVKAIWNGVVIAESNETKVVEGNHYFPPDSIKKEYLKESKTTSICPWKGKASYYDVVVKGKVNKAAAWHYPKPSLLAKKIKDHIAFWNGIEIKE
jgi:uncharacterized protein (DUF427 family)